MLQARDSEQGIFGSPFSYGAGRGAQLGSNLPGWTMRPRKTRACEVDGVLTLRSKAARLSVVNEIDGGRRDTSILIMRPIAGQIASRARITYIYIDISGKSNPSRWQQCLRSGMPNATQSRS